MRKFSKQPKPQPVDYDNNVEDVLLLVLAAIGFSNKGIMHYTGFSESQVTYRIYISDMAGARKAFRDGEKTAVQNLMSIGYPRGEAIELLWDMGLPHLLSDAEAKKAQELREKAA